MEDLRLEQIQFGYNPLTPVIKDLSCRFLPGRFYSVLGPNGSGKTTLLDLITGFLAPDAGSVWFGDQPLTGLSKKKIASTMALVSQDYSVNFPFPVQDVIMMGRHPYIPRFSRPGALDFKKVEQSMETCGVSHLRNKRINELSGGERQRCIFARALCQDTPVLLLDEAFSNMDIAHTLHLLAQIRRQTRKKNQTIISVFHDLNLASAWADELVLLKDGNIHVMGSSQEVLTRSTIKKVFNVDAAVSIHPELNRKQVAYPVN